MKPKLYVLAAALVLFVAATGTSYAQQYPLSVKIPFAFQAGDHTLPAGEYVVDSAVSGTRVIQRLRQVDGNAVMIVMTTPGTDVRNLSWCSTVMDRQNSCRRSGRETTKGCNCSSPTVRSVPQSEKEDAKLHCFCNQQASGRNFCRHVASSSFNEIRARLAGHPRNFDRKANGSRSPGFRLSIRFQVAETRYLRFARNPRHKQI